MNAAKRTKIYQLLLVGVSLAAILLLAGGLTHLQFKPGESFNLLGWLLSQLEQSLIDAQTVPESPSFWNGLSEGTRTIILLVFWSTLIFSLIYAIISPEFRRELVRLFLFILPLVILLPYIAQKFMAARSARSAMDGQMGDMAAGELHLPAPPPFIQDPPTWFLSLVKGLALVLILAGITWLWYQLRPKTDAQAVVVRHVRQALADLETGIELKNVVIACYAKMCRELQEVQGIQRSQDMTPREFEEHLAGAGIASQHIQQLTRLFEGARYSAQPTDEVTENQAIQSLKEVLQAYGA